MGVITALAAGGLATGIAVTGAAAPSGPLALPEGGVLQQRVERFCERVPGLAERAGKAGPRLAGDADTPGSIAALTERLEKARAAGRDRAVDRLERRLERRKGVAERLPERVERLGTARQECGAIGLGGGAAPAP